MQVILAIRLHWMSVFFLQNQLRVAPGLLQVVAKWGEGGPTASLKLSVPISAAFHPRPLFTIHFQEQPPQQPLRLLSPHPLPSSSDKCGSNIATAIIVPLIFTSDAFLFLQHPSHQNSSTEDYTVWWTSVTLVVSLKSSPYPISALFLAFSPGPKSESYNTPFSPQFTSPVTKFGQKTFSVQISLSLTVGSARKIPLHLKCLSL